jgi:hypothetical protein
MYACLMILGGAKFIPGWIKAAWASRHKKPTCHHDHKHEENHG